ncbi:MAG: HAD family hydrolase [Thermomicrobiales bacterium]
MTRRTPNGPEPAKERRTPIQPPPRLVLFDLDDTLCDYVGARALRLRIAFSLAMAGQSPDSVMDVERLIEDSLAIHPHGTEHFAELFERHDIGGAEEAAIASNWYRANRFHGLDLFADAVQTLQSVRQALPRRRLGMVTNGPTEVQRAKIELLGVESHVDFIIISEEFGAWKPDPAIFREALRLGEAEPDDAVFIGDSPDHDMAGARAAGIRAIWVNRSGLPWPAEAPSPDYEVADLAAVRRLLGVSSDGRSARS